MCTLKLPIFIISSLILSACASTVEDLKDVGKRPSLTRVDPPVMWAPNPETMPIRNSNSLWQQGSRDFFKDNKARRVGDILKVKVEINNNAKIDNKTTTTRKNNENLGVQALFNMNNKATKFLTPGLGTTADNSIAGTGLIDRKDDIKTEIAAMVKQILPNGCLVIQGTQEIRINAEVRELSVAGIVRQEDISAENSVNSDQIAEARISYGGRGNLSRVQQPRWGSQVLDVLLPW